MLSIYHIFAGHDATKGLAKMSLEPQDLDQEPGDLQKDELEALNKFYDLFTKKYKVVGKLAKL